MVGLLRDVCTSNMEARVMDVGGRNPEGSTEILGKLDVALEIAI